MAADTVPLCELDAVALHHGGIKAEQEGDAVRVPIGAGPEFVNDLSLGAGTSAPRSFVPLSIGDLGHRHHTSPSLGRCGRARQRCGRSLAGVRRDRGLRAPLDCIGNRGHEMRSGRPHTVLKPAAQRGDRRGILR